MQAPRLVITRAAEQARGTQPGPDTLIPLSSNEIRRLFTRLVSTVQHHTSHILHWSQWRRRRQAQARAAHYRKRLEPP
ncbi:hypothetical protein GCM10010170_098350 [Dactylosporangium salmoneum]|uniref:Uncharacterized protein n=1 Tax=Dactylosporangium salmoneum TaxID=53361 RepID=A0ABP5UT84_9ACTN